MCRQLHACKVQEVLGSGAAWVSSLSSTELEKSLLFSAAHVCLAGLTASGNAPMCPPLMFRKGKEITDSHHLHQHYMGSGIQTQVLSLMGQALTSHSSLNPKF